MCLRKWLLISVCACGCGKLEVSPLPCPLDTAKFIPWSRVEHSELAREICCCQQPKSKFSMLFYMFSNLPLVCFSPQSSSICWKGCRYETLINSFLSSFFRCMCFLFHHLYFFLPSSIPLFDVPLCRKVAYDACSSMFVLERFLHRVKHGTYCEMVFCTLSSSRTTARFNIYKDETDIDVCISVGQPAGFSLLLRLDNAHAGGREE